jgi:hypothetical protein
MRDAAIAHIRKASPAQKNCSAVSCGAVFRTDRTKDQTLVTFPFLMQRVQTHMRLVFPLPSVTRTD